MATLNRGQYQERCKKAVNRPFPSSKKSHFQNEAKCEAIDMKMIFNYYANKTHFHNKGFALSLVLKVRFFGTRKWPIVPPTTWQENRDPEEIACCMMGLTDAWFKTI